MPTYANILTEQLVSLAGKVPDAVDVLQLAQPDVGTVQGRLTALASTVVALTGLDARRAEVATGKDRTLLHLPGQLRATGFHASGALSVQFALGPFEDDPGDRELTAMLDQAADRLGLSGLLPADDALGFERLWRIKAAGGDRSGTLSAPPAVPGGRRIPSCHTRHPGVRKGLRHGGARARWQAVVSECVGPPVRR